LTHQGKALKLELANSDLESFGCKVRQILLWRAHNIEAEQEIIEWQKNSGGLDLWKLLLRFFGVNIKFKCNYIDL